ncbi:MAG: endonuclease III domain-containing protein [Candidatus Ranarchaeia archaeon]
MLPPINKVCKLLIKKYKVDTWWPAESKFEIAVGAILTQNTNWKNVTTSIGNLKKKKYLDVNSIVNENILEEIKPSGFFNQKSAYLKSFSLHLLKNYDGEIEKLFIGDIKEKRKELLSIKGIGKETADSILLYAGNKAIFVIDSYTKRLYRRLGYPTPVNYDSLQLLFQKEIENDVLLFKEIHGSIVEHCKEICTLRKPRCDNCIFMTFCKKNY